MRRWTWTLLMLPLVAACGGGTGGAGGANASCVGPYLDDQPPDGDAHRGGPAPTVSPGESIRVYGHWYTSTCNDTGGHDRDPMVPLKPVHLSLSLPGGQVQQLGAFSPAGRDMGFTTQVVIPAGTPAGTATLSDGRAYPATYRIRVGAGGTAAPAGSS